MPTTTSSKSMGGSFTIAQSRSFCRPHPSPIWVPKDRSRTHRCGVTICPVYGVENLIKLYRLLSTVFSVLIFSHPSALQLLLCSFCSAASALQKHCAKISICSLCFRDPGLVQRVLHHCVLQSLTSSAYPWASLAVVKT